MVVVAYLTREHKTIARFKDNKPGDHWASSLTQRWNLTNRIASNNQHEQARVMKEEPKSYFITWKLSPSKIGNYDETNVRDNPGAKKVLIKRRTKYPEHVIDSSKASYSLTFSGNAEGSIPPLHTVYKSVHLYNSWVKNGPQGAHYKRAKSGWFDEVTFEDWFFTLVLTKLWKQERKKVLIGENLSSHLTATVIKACKLHNIAFICLSPNATYHLQPLDVAYYGPLKKAWQFWMARICCRPQIWNTHKR